MKNVVLLDEDGKITIGSSGKNRPEAVIVSPLDIHTYVVAIPPLKQDQINGAVRYRLRALHPGNPEAYRVDYLPNGDTRKSVIAFVADASVAERYRDTGLRALAPSSFLRRFAPRQKEKWIGLFCTQHWIEATSFDGNEIIAMEAAPAGSYEIDTIRFLLKAVADPSSGAAPPMRLLIVPGSLPDPDLVVRNLRSAGMTAIEACDLSMLPARAIHSEETLFTDAPKRKRVTRRLLATLFAVDLVLAVTAVHRVAGYRERELENLKASYASTMKKLAETETAIRELDELEKRHSTYIKSRPINTYATIAEITRCIGSSAWIKDLSIRGKAFALDAEGADALAVMTRFNDSPRFSSITLRQAVPSPERGESFSISGTIRDDR